MTLPLTRAEVYGAFKIFCKEAHLICRDDIDETKRYTTVAAGSLYLEYVKKEGYRIQQVGYEDGVETIHMPFGLTCRPAKEMISTLEFSVRLLRHLRLERRKLRTVERIRRIKAQEGEELSRLPLYWRELP